jgi:hypothetical protein
MTSNSTLTRLDEAINEVTDPAESECELLREHLETARTDLVGEMRAEYAMNLKLASEALNCIANRERRERVHRILDGLLASAR